MGAGRQRWWREPLDTSEAIEREYRRLAAYMAASDRPDWWDYWMPVRNDDPFTLDLERRGFSVRLRID